MPNVTAVNANPFTIEEARVIRPAMHHVNLKTARLQEMIDWYGKVIGAWPTFQADTLAFLSNDEANHRVALTGMPGLVDDDEKLTRTGMHHSAFEYDTYDDLLSSYVRLKSEGILPGGCLDHGLTTSFYYIDPDDNAVELQADNYGDWTKSTEFINTDEGFRENPIGHWVDPDQLIEARRSGLSPWEVHERAWQDEYVPSGPIDIRLPL